MSTASTQAGTQPSPEQSEHERDSGTPVLLRPRDPLIFRDARPFAADPGARAFSQQFPMPRTVAGALRTHVINAAAPGATVWDKTTATKARQISVHGPLLVARSPGENIWNACVPAPADVVPFRKTIVEDGKERQDDDLSFMCLRPVALPEDGGCDFDALASDDDSNGKRAAMARVKLRPMSVTEEIKPETNVPAYWSLQHAMQWLSTTGTSNDDVRKTLSFVKRTVKDREKEILTGIDDLPTEERVHVSIDPDSQTNVHGALFATEARAFHDEPRQKFAGHEDMLGPEYRTESDTPATALLCKVQAAERLNRDSAYLPLGGERRLTRVDVDELHAAWPEPIMPPAGALNNVHGLRLQLVTPAIFTHGWLPGWMADGTPPGLKNMKLELRLVGIVSERRVPVSGWRLANRGAGQNAQPPGPRATVYAVPAGGVYFFEFVRGELTEETWKALWLRPVSDLGLHRDEGFGLVLPGVW